MNRMVLVAGVLPLTAAVIVQAAVRKPVAPLARKPDSQSVKSRVKPPVKPTPAVPPTVQARKLVEAAITLLDGGDVAGAKLRFEKAATLDPKAATPRFNLAVLAAKEKNWPEAVTWMEAFLSIESETTDWARGQLLIAEFRKQAAGPALPEMATREDFLIKLEAVDTLRSQGKEKEAIEAARKLSAEMAIPESWRAHAVTGSLLASRHDYLGASVALAKALERAPAEERSTIEGLLDQVQRRIRCNEQTDAASKAMQAGEFQQAASRYAEAILLCPDRDDLRIAEALAHTRSGNSKKAVAQLRTLVNSQDLAIAAQARELVSLLELPQKAPGVSVAPPIPIPDLPQLKTPSAPSSDGLTATLAALRTSDAKALTEARGRDRVRSRKFASLNRAMDGALANMKLAQTEGEQLQQGSQQLTQQAAETPGVAGVAGAVGGLVAAISARNAARRAERERQRLTVAEGEMRKLGFLSAPPAARHVTNAEELIGIGRLDEAIEEYIVAADLSPDKAGHFENLMSVLERAKLWERGEQALGELQQAMPKAEFPAAYHAKALLKLGRIDAAAVSFRLAEKNCLAKDRKKEYKSQLESLKGQRAKRAK